MTRKLLFSFLSIVFLTFNSQAQVLVSSELINTAGGGILAFVSPIAQYDVNTYKITYNTMDVDGSMTVASGAVMIPMNTGCDFFPLISYSHGTVLERDNVPSRNNTESIIPKVLASTGKVTVAHDYLGLGDNAGLHPYIHAESQATAAIDLMRAAREFIEDSLSISLSGEVFLTGYSQGGHGAMATAKYIQDNNLLGEFDIRAVAPASGPYNLSGSQSSVLLSNQPYSNPGYICYLLFAYNRVYGNIFTNYSDILKAPYDQIIPPYFDGTFPMDSVNNQLPAVLSGFIQDSVLANLNATSTSFAHPIWQALLANDNFDWAPNFPMELYYCTMDEQVNYLNSIVTADSMTAAGAVSVVAVNNGALTHGGCVLPSISAASAFFDLHATPCSNIGLQDKFSKGLVSIYPNPASGYFSLNGLDSEARIIIHDLQGKLVLDRIINSEERVDISDLKNSIYALRIISENQMISTKLVVH